MDRSVFLAIANAVTGYSTCLEFNPSHAVVPMPSTAELSHTNTYNRLLLLVAGLGGLLYGVDVGIIGGALPYLEATSGLNASQLSIIVAAVLLGSVISTLFAGLLADWLGRKPLMVISGAIFVLSIPVIALSHGFGPLFLGRLLQGVSGGLVGIVVPLYLAECLSAQDRGNFPMAVDPRRFFCSSHWHLLQLSRGGDHRLHIPSRAAWRERPGMAAHLLDVDAAGHPVCGG
jgi:hypothetical protein